MFPQWDTPVTLKPMYYWDVPVYFDNTCVKANRVDARFLDHKGKRVWAVEIDELSVCGESPEEGEEKTAMYGRLRWELRKQSLNTARTFKATVI